MALKLNVDSLDELDGLIPHVQSMGAGPQPMGDVPPGPQPTTPHTVVPPLSPMQESNIASGTHLQPGVGKELFQKGLPSVSAQPFTPENYQQKEQRADYEKMHPWGSEVSEHPGTWGKIAHVASKVGNIAGDILAPATMANIPGTDLNKQREEARNQRGFSTATQNEERQTMARKAEADIPLEQAQTKNLEVETKERPGLAESEIAERNAQAANLLHPQAKTDFEAWQKQNPGKPVEEWLKSKATEAAAGRPQNEMQTWMAAHPDKSIDDYMKAKKEEGRAARVPTDREEWMADHKGQTNPNTGKPYSMEDYWTAKAGAGGAAKELAAEEAGRAAQAYADDYLKSGRFTGAGDEALMEKYFELAKPSSGFRMTQPQLEMLTKAQDLMNSVVAKGKHLFSPEAPYFSNDLRNQIVETMRNLQKSRDEVKPGAASAAGGKGGGISIERDANERIIGVR